MSLINQISHPAAVRVCASAPYRLCSSEVDSKRTKGRLDGDGSISRALLHHQLQVQASLCRPEKAHCMWSAAAPRRTSKLSPNAALVRLPSRLLTPLNPKCPQARFYFFLNIPPTPLFGSRLPSKAAALLLLRGIFEKHDVVKLMLKDLVGAGKWGACVCVCP